MSTGVSQNDVFLGSDASFVEAAAGELPDAWDWERLDAHLRPRLVAVGMRRFGCTPEEAEDLVQDIFEAVLVKRPRVRNVEGYLVSTFFNRCFDRVEERTRKLMLEASLDAAHAEADGVRAPPDRLPCSRRVPTPDAGLPPPHPLVLRPEGLARRSRGGLGV